MDKRANYTNVSEQVISLMILPISQREIARRLNVPKSTAHYWIKKYKGGSVSSEKRREYESNYKKKRRLDPNYRAQEAESKKQSRKRKLLNKQRRLLQVCDCCDRLWFEIRNLKKSNLISKKGASEAFVNSVFTSEEGRFCNTCYVALNKLKFPKLMTSPTYLQSVRSQLRSADRTAARPDNLIRLYREYAPVRVKHPINISFRKRKGMDLHSEGYKFLKKVKNSPVYWLEENKRVLAAIRKFGLPQFILTLSAAETDFMQIQYHRGEELCRKDPVICALYFDHKIRKLIQKLSLKQSYYRIEFDSGSPIARVIVWLENDAAHLEAFIDSFMTCSADHAFARTYQTSGAPPVDKTRILQPSSSFFLIRSNLENNENASSYDEFLLSLNLTRCIDSIRSGIKKPTVFLKRDLAETRINPKVLSHMQSPMDIQYVASLKDCKAYLDIPESQKKMMNVIKKCRGSLRSIANQFLEFSKKTVCAQEAAWILLGLPMSKLSVADIFIPTFPTNNRVRVLKKRKVDVFELSIIDKYVQRPIRLEELCLADFATGFEFVKKREKKEEKKEDKLLNCDLYVRERKERKILRCVNYRNDPDNLFREQVIQFTKWRDEERDVLSKNCKFFFEEKKVSIEEIKKKHYNNGKKKTICYPPPSKMGRSDPENEDDSIQHYPSKRFSQLC